MLELLRADVRKARAKAEVREPAREQGAVESQLLFGIKPAVRHAVRVLIAQQTQGEMIEGRRPEGVVVIDAREFGGDGLIARRRRHAERIRAVDLVIEHVVE